MLKLNKKLLIIFILLMFTLTITVNATDETLAEWKAVLGKKMCFMTIVPGLSDAFFVIANVPNKIPQPSLDQNGLLTVAMNCTIDDFIGLDEAIDVLSTI